VFHQDESVLGLWDGYPVSPGHALLVPRRHIALWDEATSAEQVGLTAAIDIAQNAVREHHAPAGFNVGMNLGAAAGQTVPHLHIHVIPRYTGDVVDPRGGVRWVIPEHADYWTSQRS
jgi:diadenosine tetraphosphate (Ap4A) HIT family hydrolase